MYLVFPYNWQLINLFTWLVKVFHSIWICFGTYEFSLKFSKFVFVMLLFFNVILICPSRPPWEMHELWQKTVKHYKKVFIHPHKEYFAKLKWKHFTQWKTQTNHNCAMLSYLNTLLRFCIKMQRKSAYSKESAVYPLPHTCASRIPCLANFAPGESNAVMPFLSPDGWLWHHWDLNSQFSNNTLSERRVEISTLYCHYGCSFNF